jgi:hypothetical protein
MRIRSHLAGGYEAAGQLEKAITLHEQNYTDRQRILGPDHPETTASRTNLAKAKAAWQ